MEDRMRLKGFLTGAIGLFAAARGSTPLRNQRSQIVDSQPQLVATLPSGFLIDYLACPNGVSHS